MFFSSILEPEKRKDLYSLSSLEQVSRLDRLNRPFSSSQTGIPRYREGKDAVERLGWSTVLLQRVENSSTSRLGLSRMYPGLVRSIGAPQSCYSSDAVHHRSLQWIPAPSTALFLLHTAHDRALGGDFPLHLRPLDHPSLPTHATEISERSSLHHDSLQYSLLRSSRLYCSATCAPRGHPYPPSPEGEPQVHSNFSIHLHFQKFPCT